MREEAELRTARVELGKDTLGPIVADYLSRLYTHIVSLESISDARVLFVSRAGIRIRMALDAFIQSTGLPRLDGAENFWVSRLLVAKAVWKRSPDQTIQILSKEFAYAPIPELLNAMFRFAPAAARRKFDDVAPGTMGASLKEFLASKHPAAEMLKVHFDEQGALFESYLNRLLGKRKKSLLVDSGWQGTTQTLLSRAFPEYEWWGAYFGLSGFPESDRTFWPNMIGLAFESDTFQPERPETSIVLNRHLIEHLFEPSGRSVEWLARNPEGKIVAPDAEVILADDPSASTDPVFYGIMEFLRGLTPGHKPAQLYAKASESWDRLAQLMVLPSRQDVSLLDDVGRSADFGRELKVPLVLRTARREGETPAERIQHALWPAGQVALEYRSDSAPAIQKRLAGGSPVKIPARATSHAKRVLREPGGLPSVAVITRTMDRPMFLKRALESVAMQTWRDYVHVIVNDGGDNDVIKEAIETTNCDHAKVVLVDAVKNRGMEAASNLAIRNSNSEYVVIHDDDDTWEPEFLSKSIGFMRSAAGRNYGGVITKSTYCSEEVTPNGIVVHARAPYQGWVENVHLLEMAVSNFFPPIAFLYRRSLWETLGGYNEQYPVLGDWDFNLRFLIEADIGVIQEPLANYHHRDRGDTATFGNSVIAARNKHLEYASIVRNNFVRDLAKRGHSAAATLVGMGLYLEEQRNRLRGLDGQTQNLISRVGEVNARVSTASSALSDELWLALSRVVRALLERDMDVLGKLLKPSAPTSRTGFGTVIQKVRGQKPEASDPTGLDLEGAISTLVRDALEASSLDRRPPPIPKDFDEVAYRAQNPDVDSVINSGQLRSGYEHFIRYGRHEGRIRPKKSGL